MSVSSDPILENLSQLKQSTDNLIASLNRPEPDSNQLNQTIQGLRDRLGQINRQAQTPSPEPETPTPSPEPETPEPDTTEPETPIPSPEPETPEPDTTEPETPTPSPEPEAPKSLDEIINLEGDPYEFLKLYNKVAETGYLKNMLEQNPQAAAKMGGSDGAYLQLGAWLKEKGYIKLNDIKAVIDNNLLKGLDEASLNEDKEKEAQLKTQIEQLLLIHQGRIVYEKFDELLKNPAFVSAGKEAKAKIKSVRPDLEILFGEDASELSNEDLYNKLVLKNKPQGEQLAQQYDVIKKGDGGKAYQVFDQIKLPEVKT